MSDDGKISESLKQRMWWCIHHGALAISASSPPTILLPVYDNSRSFSFLSSLLIFSNKGRTPHSDKRQFNINYQLIIQDIKPPQNRRWRYQTLFSIAKAAGAKESLSFAIKSCSLSTTCFLYKLVQRGVWEWMRKREWCSSVGLEAWWFMSNASLTLKKFFFLLY